MDEHPNPPEEGSSWLDKLSTFLSGNEPKTKQDLVDILREAKEDGLIDADALSMVEGVFDVADMRARDIMIPRSQMDVLNIDDDDEHIIARVIRAGHSRFPVISESKDQVEGILLAKDVLKFVSDDAESKELRSYLRAPAFIPESKRLDVLLRQFRSSRNHMAIVMDEYGGVAGLVTIEDVLEQIVGDIDDEFDEAQTPDIYSHSDSRHSVKALTPIEAFNDYFETNLPTDEFDTIGGLVMHSFGHLPRRGEQIDLDKFRFTIQAADKRRIYLLKAAILNESAD